MVRYLIRRILWAGVLFLVVTIVTFVIFFLYPERPRGQGRWPGLEPGAARRARD